MTDSEETELLPCPRRGRPRVRRIIEGIGESRCYKPCCRPDEENEGISLKPEEIELIRLIDLEGLEQEEAAEKLGVSRKTAWRDLHEARRKIADALVNWKGNRDGWLHKSSRRPVSEVPPVDFGLFSFRLLTNV